MTEDLRYRAIHALEGTDRSPDALRSLAEYANELVQRYGQTWLKTDERMTRELVLLLETLRASADPAGDSPFQMKIERRGRKSGPKPNPSAQRRRILKAVAAAREADRMLEVDPEMQAKAAHSLVAERHGVSESEIYEARKDPMYVGVEFDKLDKALKDCGF